VRGALSDERPHRDNLTVVNLPCRRSPPIGRPALI
jgi:hypothetical protein